jgi:hypothetical protein
MNELNTKLNEFSATAIKGPPTKTTRRRKIIEVIMGPKMRDEVSQTVSSPKNPFTLKSFSNDHTSQNTILMKNISPQFPGHKTVNTSSLKYLGNTRISNSSAAHLAKSCLCGDLITGASLVAGIADPTTSTSYLLSFTINEDGVVMVKGLQPIESDQNGQLKINTFIGSKEQSEVTQDLEISTNETLKCFVKRKFYIKVPNIGTIF